MKGYENLSLYIFFIKCRCSIQRDTHVKHGISEMPYAFRKFIFIINDIATRLSTKTMAR